MGSHGFPFYPCWKAGGPSHVQVSISNIIYEGQYFMKLSSSAGSEFFQSSHGDVLWALGIPELGLRGFFNTLFTYFRGGKTPMSEVQCYDGLCEALSTGFLVEMGTRAVPIIKSYILRAWLLVLDLTLPEAEASWRELVVCFVCAWGGGEVIPGKDPTGVCLSSFIGAIVWIILCLMKMSPKHIPFPWRIKIITVTMVNMY